MLVIKNPKRQPAKNAQTVQECCYIWSVFFLQTLPFQFVLAGTASLLYRELDSHLQGEWNLFEGLQGFSLSTSEDRVQLLWQWGSELSHLQQLRPITGCARAALSYCAAFLTSLNIPEDLKNCTFYGRTRKSAPTFSCPPYYVTSSCNTLVFFGKLPFHLSKIKISLHVLSWCSLDAWARIRCESVVIKQFHA